MSEIEYRSIEGAPGYRVGDDGSVWSCKNGRWGFRDIWKRLRAAPDAAGYPTVALKYGTRFKTIRVNVLVLLVFVGTRPIGLDSCHGNGRPSDCRLGNLRWDTRKANAADAVRHGTIRSGSASPYAKLSKSDADYVRTSSERGCDLALRFNVSQATICRYRKGANA